MEITLTEFERQTLAYILFGIRKGGACFNPINTEEVLITIDEELSADEYRAMWELGLRIMEV